MHYKQGFKGRFIGAAEFGGKTPTLTIKSAEILSLEDEKGGAKDRLILWFSETKRGMVVNRTNAECIAAMFGPETDDWAGKRLTLRSEMVQLGRERVPGIRIEGSPDIAADMEVEIRLPKKRPTKTTLRRTGAAKEE